MTAALPINLLVEREGKRERERHVSDEKGAVERDEEGEEER